VPYRSASFSNVFAVSISHAAPRGRLSASAFGSSTISTRSSSASGSCTTSSKSHKYRSGSRAYPEDDDGAVHQCVVGIARLEVRLVYAPVVRKSAVRSRALRSSGSRSSRVSVQSVPIASAVSCAAFSVVVIVSSCVMGMGGACETY
jgi:hypothetical protein